MSEEIEQPRWIEKAAAALLSAEDGLPVPHSLRGEDFPRWVGNVFTALLKATMPGTIVKDPKLWSPGDLGAFLGNKTTFWDDPEDYDPARVRQLAKDLKKEGDRVGTVIVIKYIRRLWMVGWPQYREAASQCFALVVGAAPHHQKIKFFRSYLKALQQPQTLDGTPSHATTATPIYSFLMIYWRAVEKLNSMAEFHSLLCRVFGSATMGDQKRVEKICERIGLSFAKAAKAKEVPNATDNPA